MIAVAAPTLPALGTPVVIDPAGVSGHVAAKAAGIAEAELLAREDATDIQAVYLVGGETGTYYVRLTLGRYAWVGECEHPARTGTPGGRLCAHIWAAAESEARDRGATIPNPHTPPCSYEEYLAAWRRHQRQADQPGDTDIIHAWQQWRARPEGGCRG